MKIYISLPITGHDFTPDPRSTYAQHMGNDIAALLECEAARIYQTRQYYSLDETDGHGKD